MDIFKKPECVPLRKIVNVSGRGKHYSARLESSVTPDSPSSSLCSEQSKCSGYNYVTSLFKSVINNSISSNESKLLSDSSGLHSSIKKFGETVWLDLLNTTKEWQIEGFVEKHKEMKMRLAMSKGSLHKKMMTFERWWCVLTEELELCVQGFVENKNGVVQTEPIIKRMDPHTVASRNSLYKLKNFCGKDCVPGLPQFIKNKFACGFPEDWKLLKKKWLMFLREGEPRDFQWNRKDSATSAENCSPIQNLCGQSSQESSFEAFTDKTQQRDFAFPSVIANNKFTERVLTLGSKHSTVEKHATENFGNMPHTAEDRVNRVIVKRNEPQSSNSAAVTSTTTTTTTTTTTKKNIPATKNSFEIVTDDSENSSDEDTGIFNMQTNCQDAKRTDNHYGSKKQQSVVKRRTNTPQVSMGNEILLEKWLPVLNGQTLCFKGVRSVGNSTKTHTTASVKSRVKSDTVTLVDGKKCILIGHLYDVHNSLPAEIGSKFKSGMPVHWRKVLNMWVTYSSSTEEKSAPRSGSSQVNNQQQGILKKSSRGRVLLQPVKHWLGETPSSVINSMAEKQEELLNSKDSQALPAEKILSSASGREKCGVLNKPGALPQKNVKNSVNSKRKKELVDRNVKKSKREQQHSRANSDKIVNNVPLGGSSHQNNEFENPTYFTNSERRVLRSQNKQIIAEKESLNAILNERKSDGKKTVSCRSRSYNKISRGKSNGSSTIPVVVRDNKDSTSPGKSKPTIKNTKKKAEVRSLKQNDMDIDFTDFLGKPPRTLKQRKKLDKVVKTLSQNNKKNMDFFDDISEDSEKSRAAWDDFIAVDDIASFITGEETPRSKMLDGSYFRTPEASPSHSMFQITPCNNDEVLRYVHQQKTKTDKPLKKTDTKKTKLSFIHASTGNQAIDGVYAALLKGEPIPKHIISKGMRVDDDDGDDDGDGDGDGAGGDSTFGESSY